MPAAMPGERSMEGADNGASDDDCGLRGMPAGAITEVCLIDHTSLDQVGENNFVLTHSLSHERVHLPRGDYELVANREGGSYALVAVDMLGQAEVSDVDSKFTQVVWEHDDTKELFVMQAAKGAASLVSLDDKCARHRVAIVTYNPTPVTNVDLVCFVFSRARAGNILLHWSLLSLYKLLGMSSFGGSGARWVRELHKGWNKTLGQYVAGCGVVLSTFTSPQTTERVKLPMPERCLSEPAVSSFGMIWLCSRFGMCNNTNGGLEKPEARSIAMQFVSDCFRTVARARQAWEFEFVLDERWRCVWPRPDTSFGKIAVRMQVSPDGLVDLSEWARYACVGVRDSAWGKFFAPLKKAKLSDWKVDLFLLQQIFAAGASKVSRILMAQLSLHLARRLEKVMGGVAKKSIVLTALPPLTFQWSDDKVDFAKGHQVDQVCTKYVLAGLDSVSGSPELSIATDKGSVGQLPLQNTLLVAPNNAGVLACPAVDTMEPCVSPLGALSIGFPAGFNSNGTLVVVVRFWGCAPPKSAPPPPRSLLELILVRVGLRYLLGRRLSRVHVVEVCRLFDSNLFEPGRSSVKRPAPSSGATASQAARQRAWLHRGKETVKAGSWKPIKKYRLGAKKWAMAVDNQIRGSSRFAGLSRFRPQLGSPAWAPGAWATWPHLSVCLDLGADGVAAMHGLMHHADMKCNMTLHPDPSHGANRSLDQALRASGLRGWWIMNMISFNLPFGPDRTGERGVQIWEACKELFLCLDKDSCPLFQELSGLILESLTLVGVTLAGEDDTETELWNYLANRNWMTALEERCNLNRFLSSITSARANHPWSWVHLFERLFCCIEMDWLGNKKSLGRLVKMKASDTGGEHHEQRQTTGGNTLCIDDAALRGTAANACVIGVSLLQDMMNFRLLGGIVGIADPVRRWHIEQNRELRSVSGSEAWISRQSLPTTGYMLHVAQIAEALCDISVLQKAGFAVQGKPASLGDCLEEDFLCGLLSRYQWNLVAARLRRGLYLTSGWPCQLFRLLGPAHQQKEVAQRFQDDWKAFQALNSMENPSVEVRRVVQRSDFQKTAVMQFVHGCVEGGWKPTSEVCDLARRRARSVLGTQVVGQGIPAYLARKAAPSGRRKAWISEGHLIVGGVWLARRIGVSAT